MEKRIIFNGGIFMFEEPVIGFNEKQKELINRFWNLIHNYCPDYTDKDIMEDTNTKILYNWTDIALKRL